MKRKKNEKTGKPRKVWKGILTALACILALAALYALFCLTFGRVVYPEFYAQARRVAAVPEKMQGFIPQGVTSLGEQTLVCGYMQGKGASRVQILSGAESKTVLLQKEDGSAYTGHAGGMSACGDSVYISNASKIFVLKTSDLLGAADGETVSFCGSFDVPCRSSFCSCDGEYLYVGEFHTDGYETDESHRVSTGDGDYQALVFAFPISASEEFGVETAPRLVYAVRDKVQGFAVKEGKAALSCSYGLASSVFSFYDVSGSDSVFRYEGEDLPLCVLDSARLEKEFRAPHMSEDLEYTADGLLTVFEGGAKKYGAGVLPFSLFDVMRLEEDT